MGLRNKLMTLEYEYVFVPILHRCIISSSPKCHKCNISFRKTMLFDYKIRLKFKDIEISSKISLIYSVKYSISIFQLLARTDKSIPVRL